MTDMNFNYFANNRLSYRRLNNQSTQNTQNTQDSQNSSTENMFQTTNGDDYQSSNPFQTANGEDDGTTASPGMSLGEMMKTLQSFFAPASTTATTASTETT